MSDCHEVMQLLLKTQIDWDSISDDDPQVSCAALLKTISVSFSIFC